MKVKTCVTGLNRKQLRSLALQQDADLEWQKLENALAIKKLRIANDKNVILVEEKVALTSELDQANTEIKELTEKCEVNQNEYEKLYKDHIKLEDRLHIMELNEKESTDEIRRLKDRLSEEKEKNDKLEAELNKTLWKKVLRCFTK